MTENSAVRTNAPVTGLSHVQLLVSDVSASAEWYTVALGLEPYAGSVDTGYVALRHRGANVVVVLTRPSQVGDDQVAVATSPGNETLDHLAFAVSDEGALQRGPITWPRAASIIPASCSRTGTLRCNFATPTALPSSWLRRPSVVTDRQRRCLGRPGEAQSSPRSSSILMSSAANTPKARGSTWVESMMAFRNWIAPCNPSSFDP